MKNLILLIVGTFVLVSLSSCSSNDEALPSDTTETVKGTSNFIAQLNSNVSSSATRSESEEEILPLIIKESIEYLNANNISYKEFFEDENDPQIAILAMGLAEYDKCYNLANTRTSVGGCVLEAIGVKDLVSGAGAKIVAKQVGKALLKKAVPYVGWGIFAVDMAMCLAD